MVVYDTTVAGAGVLSPKGAGVLGDSQMWEEIPAANPDVLEKQLSRVHEHLAGKGQCGSPVRGSGDCPRTL